MIRHHDDTITWLLLWLFPLFLCFRSRHNYICNNSWFWLKSFGLQRSETASSLICFFKNCCLYKWNMIVLCLFLVILNYIVFFLICVFVNIKPLLFITSVNSTNLRRSSSNWCLFFSWLNSFIMLICCFNPRLLLFNLLLFVLKNQIFIHRNNLYKLIKFNMSSFFI